MWATQICEFGVPKQDENIDHTCANSTRYSWSSSWGKDRHVGGTNTSVTKQNENIETTLVRMVASHALYYLIECLGSVIGELIIAPLN